MHAACPILCGYERSNIILRLGNSSASIQIRPPAFATVWPGRYFTSLCPSHHICKTDIITLASSSLGRSEDYLSLFICVKHIGARLAQSKCLGSKMWTSWRYFKTTPSTQAYWFLFSSWANWGLRLKKLVQGPTERKWQPRYTKILMCYQVLENDSDVTW